MMIACVFSIGFTAGVFIGFIAGLAAKWAVTNAREIDVK